MKIINGKPIATEAQECITFFDMCKRTKIIIPEWDIVVPLSEYVIHIPNEGKRTNAGHITQARMGKQPGASDYIIAIPVERWHGVFIEMKIRDLTIRASPTQIEFIKRMKLMKYWGVIAYGADEAFEHILSCYSPIIVRKPNARTYIPKTKMPKVIV